MRFIFRLGIAIVAIAVSYELFPLFGYFVIVGSIIYLIISSGGEDDQSKSVDKSKESLWPSSPPRSDVSSAWLGARMNEEEARRREGEKEPRDQGH